MPGKRKRTPRRSRATIKGVGNESNGSRIRRHHCDEFSRPSIKAGSIKPTEYDLVEVAEAIGDQFSSRVSPVRCSTSRNGSSSAE